MVSHQESPTVESKRNHYVDLCLERSCTRCDWWCRGDRHALSLSLFPWRLPNCLLIRWVMPGRRFVQIRAPLRLDVWSTRLTSQLCLQQHHDRLRAKLLLGMSVPSHFQPVTNLFYATWGSVGYLLFSERCQWSVCAPLFGHVGISVASALIPKGAWGRGKGGQRMLWVSAWEVIGSSSSLGHIWSLWHE